MAWIPSARARLRAEFDRGSSSRAFHRLEPLGYARWKLRGEFRPAARLTLSGGAVMAENRNDTAGVNHDLDDRQASFQATWAASARLLLSGGYNFLRMRSSTDIVFFSLARLTRGRSLYETNSHVAHADAQVPLGPRLNLRLGYQAVKDTGSSWPLRLHAPRAGFALLVGKGVSLEADWQHYSYNENAFTPADYRANILSSGLRFRF